MSSVSSTHAIRPIDQIRSLLLIIALAALAKYSAGVLGRWWLGGTTAPVSPVLCAVILGLAWRNVSGMRSATEFGLQRVTRILLPFGIALVGLRLTLSSASQVSALAIPIVLACIATAFLVSTALGRWLGVATPLRYLVAVGTAVCGCTAVVATAPAVRAKPEETALALTYVVLIGCAGMIFYPWLANAWIAQGDAAGVFLGTAIHDTSQVMGAALIYSQEFQDANVVAAASLTKLLRNLSLLALVPLCALAAHTENPQGNRRPLKEA